MKKIVYGVIVALCGLFIEKILPERADDKNDARLGEQEYSFGNSR